MGKEETQFKRYSHVEQTLWWTNGGKDSEADSQKEKKKQNTRETIYFESTPWRLRISLNGHIITINTTWWWSSDCPWRLSEQKSQSVTNTGPHIPVQNHLVPTAALQGLKAVRETVETKRHTPWRHTQRRTPILFIAVWCTLLLIQGILPVIFSHYQLSKGRLLAALTPASIHLALSAARRLHSGCSHSGAKLLTYNFCFRNNNPVCTTEKYLQRRMSSHGLLLS